MQCQLVATSGLPGTKHRHDSLRCVRVPRLKKPRPFDPICTERESLNFLCIEQNNFAGPPNEMVGKTVERSCSRHRLPDQNKAN